jgi:hypothetical protein
MRGMWEMVGGLPPCPPSINVIKVISFHMSTNINMKLMERVSIKLSHLTPKAIESFHDNVNLGMGE